MVTTTAGPTVVRRQLGRVLKRLRNVAQVSVDQVVANRELGISRAKLYRLEAGQHPVKPQDVTVLCQYLGASREEISRLTALALATQNHTDAAIPEWFQLYRDLEQFASRIRYYEGEVIPGELQTADYARAVFQGGPPFDTEDEIDHQVALRLERQEKLFGRSPKPRFTTVINEAAMARPVGGEAVLKAQIERLQDLDRQPTIEIRVIPFAIGAHAGTTGSFRMLDFDDADDPNIVYLEAYIGGRYLQKKPEYARYQQLWDRIYAQAVPLKEFLR